jgi:hypothetical protein
VAIVLICSGSDLEAELGRTMLLRRDVERQVAYRADEARVLAVAAHPDLVVVDRDLRDAEALIVALRQDLGTRNASIVVAARGDYVAIEVALLEAGANAVLRLPAGPEWDDRLDRLMRVPARREGRFPVQFGIETLGHASPVTPAMGLNLSLHGMLMESSVPVIVGDEIGLVMRLPQTKGPLAARGVVVREAGPTRFGIKFVELDPGADVSIRGFVAAAQSSH